MQWKFTGDKPVYQQIMDHLRTAILVGQYPPGARIPAVRELAAEANVNPNTMQRALTALEGEQLLVCCGTTGRFVTDDQAVLVQTRLRMQRQAALECARRLESLELTLEQAAQLLKESEE